jgi:TatA/E family protein of Tat protein translocase
LILFGAGKLPQVFESFGAGIKKFRDAQKDDAIDVGIAGAPEQITEDKLANAESAKVVEEVQRPSA